MKRLTFLAFSLLAACHPSKKSPTGSAPVSTTVPETETEIKEPVIERSEGPNSRVICKAPAGVNNDPRSMSDMMALINALPKPLSVACLIDSLKGPFKVNATASVFSAQPAFSVEAPRIFLFYSPLVISVVPTGEGGDVVEFSVKVGADESVKGEIPFPVKETLAEDAAYKNIKFEQSDATVCGSCHFGEVAAPAPYPAIAYASRILLPTSGYEVSATELEESAKRCLTIKLAECPVLEAITSKGKLIQTSFE